MLECGVYGTILCEYHLQINLKGAVILNPGYRGGAFLAGV